MEMEMKILQVPLSQLRQHPQNANVMDEKHLHKLQKHIKEHNRYEPLIARPDPTEQGCYQLLNGHHRKMVLERLGHDKATCLIWQVDDNEALVMLATLNRLSGKDDPIKRASLLANLSEKLDAKKLSSLVPETAKQLKKLLAINEPPRAVLPTDITPMPEAMTFFVAKQQKKIIDKALRMVADESIGDCGNWSFSRGDCLAIMADIILQKKAGDTHVE